MQCVLSFLRHGVIYASSVEQVAKYFYAGYRLIRIPQYRVLFVFTDFSSSFRTKQSDLTVSFSCNSFCFVWSRGLSLDCSEVVDKSKPVKKASSSGKISDLILHRLKLGVTYSYSLR